MRLPQLDGRLGAALALVPPCSLCADIGSDHGRLAAAILSENRAERVIVSDVSAPALAKARRLLTQLALDGRCDFIEADGLDALTAPCGHVCVLGMGGDTIAELLVRGKDKLCGASLTLCPQTDHELVRDAVQAIGYHLTCERVASANGRLYLLMQAEKGDAPRYTPLERKLGVFLLKDNSPLTRQWYRRQAGYLTRAVEQMRAAVVPLDAEKAARLQEYRMLAEYIKNVIDLSPDKEGTP